MCYIWAYAAQSSREFAETAEPGATHHKTKRAPSVSESEPPALSTPSGETQELWDTPAEQGHQLGVATVEAASLRLQQDENARMELLRRRYSRGWAPGSSPK